MASFDSYDLKCQRYECRCRRVTRFDRMCVFFGPGLIECNRTCRVLPACRPCESRLAMGRYCHHHCVCATRSVVSPSQPLPPPPTPLPPTLSLSLSRSLVDVQSLIIPSLPFQVRKMVQELFPYLLSICEIEQERKETSGLAAPSPASRHVIDV